VRLLILGDSAGTGFGTVTSDLGRALLARDVDVRFISLNEQPDGELSEPFAGRTAVIGNRDGWLGMADHAQTRERLGRMFTGGLFEDGWTPETAIVIGDVGSLKISPLLQFLPERFPAVHYVPIEGVGLPPAWAGLWRRLPPVAMSHFGADQIAALGLPRPPVIYHGVDTEAFYPVSDRRPIVLRGTNTLHVLKTKADCKRFVGLDPDRITLFRADRHMPRKNYASLLRALAPVLAAHQNVDLLWHCRTMDQGGDLDDERSKYPLPIAERMMSTGFHDRYGGVDRKLLNTLYNAADVYVSVSAEGFGLTIAESLACGVPAVGMDYSAVPEVIGQAGIAVPIAHLTDNIYSHFWATVDEVAFGRAVDSLVRSRGARRDLGSKGPIHVGANFTWAKAADAFLDILPQQQAVAA